MIRKSGVTVNDVAKIHLKDPGNLDHAILFDDTDFKILLLLWGIFLYFETFKPSTDTILHCEDIYLLTSSR